MSATRRITATYLAKHLSEVLERARFDGEEFVVERQGKPMCRIAPMSPPKPARVTTAGEVLKSLEGAAFSEAYVKSLKEVRRNRQKLPESPWDS